MTKEKLAEQYADSIERSEEGLVEQCFLAGYEAATLKWISVEEQLPKNDREVLVYVRNLETPHWSRLELGSYINDKWYLRKGIPNKYQIVRWMNIPKHGIEKKNLDEWNEIFGRKIETEEKVLTEKEYIMLVFKKEEL